MLHVLDQLTQQEHRVLALVASGSRNAHIARELCISVRTVENHVYHIFDKLGVSSRVEATLFALEHGLLALPEMSRNSQDAAS